MLALGATMLVAWLTGHVYLASLWPELPSMKAHTAVSIGALGLALITRERRPRLSAGLGAGVLVLVALTFGLPAVGLELDFDQWLVRDPGDSPTPGRMAFATGICLALAGLAQAPRLPVVVRVLLLVGGQALSMMAAGVYVIDPSEMVDGGIFSTMSVLTASALLVYFWAALVQHNRRFLLDLVDPGRPGGRLFRRMIWPFLVLPLLTGVTLAYLIGHGQLGVGFALAGFATAGAILGFWVLAWIARSEDALAEGAAAVDEAQSEVRELLSLLFADSIDAVLLLDGHGIVRQMNPAAQRMLGQPRDALLGRPMGATLERERRAFELALRRFLISGAQQRTLSLTLNGRDGVVEATAVFRRHREGHEAFIIAVLRDVAAAETRISELEQAAHRDALTGLSNRRALEAVRAEPSEPGVLLAVLFVDLDHFKQVNDQHGHGVGDVVLRAFADRCRGALRRQDQVFRAGGEEFVVLAEVVSRDEAVALGERLREAVRETPIRAGAARVRLTCSVGVSLVAGAERSLEAALGRADAALYRAKRGGRDQVQLAA